MSDSTVLDAVLRLRTPWLDDVMVLATALGPAGVLWLVIGAIASIYPARRAAAWRLLLAILLTSVVVDGVVKPLAGRARPFEVDPQIRLLDARPTTSSFPSGHAAQAFAGALTASRIFPAATWALWPVAIVISFSRVYLGVHWPSDVVAGAAIGLLCAWFVLGGRAPTILRR